MNSLRPLLLVAASLVTIATVATACDGSAKSPKIRSFTATPATVPSLGGDVTLVWDVSRADDLLLEPDIGAVTGTSATVHVTETTTFTLIAKKDGRVAHKRATVNVAGTSAIRGTVRSAFSRNPIVNTLVWIKGHGAVITDADGGFAFDDVETPYDIAVVDQDFFSTITVLYVGVTLANPVLEVDQINPPLPMSTTFTGTVTPAAPGGTLTAVYLDANASVPSTFPGGDSWGPLPVSWFPAIDDPSYDVVAHGLRWTLDTASQPAAYTGYGRATVSASNAVAAIANIALDPVTTEITTGTVDIDGTGVLTQVDGFMIFGVPTGSFEDQGFFLPPDTHAVTADGFALKTPAISGTVAGARLSLQDPDNMFNRAKVYLPIVPGSSNNVVELPSPPQLLLPVRGAYIERDQKFQVAGRDDSLKIIRFSSVGSLFTETLIVTQANTFTIPDLNEIGIDLFQNSQNAAWSVHAEIAPVASIDDALGQEGIAGVSPAWYGQTDVFAVHPNIDSPVVIFP